jgi:RHS repeat-associated protein
LPTSPQLAGTTIALTSTATCTGGASPAYHYWYRNYYTEYSWHDVATGYATNATTQWDTSSLPAGTYQLQVGARGAPNASSAESYAVDNFVLDAPAAISTDAPTVQDFNSLGTSATALLPTGWKIDKQANPRTVGTYAAALSKTELNAGANMAATASNGIYNFGVGVADAQASTYWLNSADRAPGWLSDGANLASGGTKSGNLYVALKAPANTNIASLSIGYEIKKFRAGANPSGFRVQLYSSADGSTWTSAGGPFQTAVPHDDTTVGSDPAPSSTVSVASTPLSVSVAHGVPFYLAWNYTVNSANSASGADAQALAIDNVSIQGSGECLSSCGTKHCGDDPANGCGGSCAITCQDGDVGCASDSACKPGSSCSGKSAGSATPNVCEPSICLTNPRLGGCGFLGAPCGQSCTLNPTCNTNQDCSAGYVCGANNGYRYGVPGANVCEKPACQTDQVATGCGSIKSECGTCTCTPSCSGKHCGDADLSDGCGGTCLALCSNHEGCTTNSDCQAGALCVVGGGERVGLPAGTNACMPAMCTSPTLAAPDCGSIASTCGLCLAQSASCGNRECGIDPVNGTQCGPSCPSGEYCSATGKCSQFDAATPIVVHDLNGGATPLTPQAAPSAVAVGATHGDFSVSDRGSATYVVPIEVPPGRQGIEPGLSVRYSSSTGNGALGVGWSLDGLSTIDRCQRTFAQDGYAQPVAVTSADAFCLDGQRLVQTGTDEYRTEVDTFAKIQVVHLVSAPLVPDYFKVFTKDGRILFFGDTSDSKASPLNGVPRSWALTRIQDRFGNFMKLVYRSTQVHDWQKNVDSTSELLPDAISYTGHDSVEGDRYLKFSYSDRGPDQLVGYQIGGGLFTRRERLDKIDVRIGTGLVRSYNFSYGSAQNNTLRLNSLQECAGSGLVCKPATQFSYFDEQGFDGGTLFAPSHPDYIYGGPEQLQVMGTVLRYNGHDRLAALSVDSTTTLSTPFPAGADMAVLAIPAVGPAISAFIDFANAFGSTKDVSGWYVRTTYDFLSNSYTYENPCGAYAQPSDHVIVDAWNNDSVYETCPELHPNDDGNFFYEAPRVWLIDVDGDGVQDKLFCDSDQVNLNYKLSKNSPLHALTTTATDASRDGQILAPELCAHKLTDQAQPFLGLDAAAADWITPMTAAFDVDGDGTGNLLVRKFTTLQGIGLKSATWEALVFDASGAHFKSLSTDFLPEVDGRHFAFSILDFNGDGLKDILALPSLSQGGSIQIPILWENTGDGLRLVVLDASGDRTGGQAPHFPGFVMDYDHDGTDELIEPGPGTSEIASQVAHPWLVRRIKAGKLISEDMPAVASPQPGESTGFPGFPGVLGDFDGDGNSDLMTRDPQVGYYLHRGSGRRQSLLKTITDGLGNHIEIKYDTTNPEGRRTYGINGGRSACQWPTSCLSAVSLPLVSSYTQSHYLDGAHTNSNPDAQVSFSYNQAYGDSGGMGWLGFDSRTITARDGAGELEKTDVITYRPLESSTDSAPISPPYTRALAGVIEETVETLPHANSFIASTSLGVGTQMEVRTQYTWTQQHSAANRPFPVLQSKLTQVSQINGFTEVENGLNVGWGLLFDHKEESSVDTYGNLFDRTTTEQDFYSSRASIAPGVIPGSVSKFHTHVTYAPTAAELGNWLINLPRALDVDDQPRCVGVATTCPELRKARRSDFQYYDNGALHVSARERGDPTLALSTERALDSYGNVETLTATEYSGKTRSVTIGYDDRRLFPVSTTNDKNQVTQFRLDDRFGALIARADANEIGETWSYDEFGILRHHHSPTEDRDIDYEPATPHSTGFGFDVPAVYHVVSSVAGGDAIDEQFDAVGHICQRQKSGFNGESVFEEFEYDGRNRLIQQTRPHSAGDTTQSATRFGYDSLNRITTKTAADLGVVRYGYAFQTDLADELVSSFATTAGAISIVEMEDPHGHVTLSAADRSGRTVKAIDALNQDSAYGYGAFGALRSFFMPSGDIISRESDAYNRIISVSDPAAGGTQTTTYNGFDEVVSETDAAQRVSNFFYDELGRIDHLQDADGTAYWTYDGTGPNEIGRLVRTVSSTGQQTDYGYESPQSSGNRGLLNTVKATLIQPDSVSSVPPRELVTTYHYDDYSRLQQIDYPGNAGAPFSVRYGFDPNGHTIKVSDAAQLTSVYWQLLEADQGFRPKTEELGNGAITTQRVYEPHTGFTSTIATTVGSKTIQNLTFEHDTDGNLIERRDLQVASDEVFDYDPLHRLGPVAGYAYDSPEGRLKHQEGVGDYTYFTTGRDWVKTAGAYSYTHDAVGNIGTRSGPDIPGGMQEISYTTFNLPSQISFTTGDPAKFAYDGSGARAVKQVGAKSTFYAGDLYQSTEVGTARNHRYMIFVEGRAVAAVSQDETAGVAGARSVQYLHDDALGSIQSITSSNGTLRTTRAFGPFGATTEPLTDASSVPVGFTGQEHDPELGLINMRGRMYDPVLGQFLSPDPVMQMPFSQGFNRFAYTFNSPLNHTDPSGFESSDTTNGIDIGIGAAYMTGLVATLASSSAGGSAAATGATAAGSEVAGLGAPSILGTAASIGAPAVAIGMNVYLAGQQPTSSGALTVQPASRSSTAGRGGTPSLGQVGRHALGSTTESMSELARSANTSKGGFPTGSVRIGEPITDPGVRLAIRQLWRDSRPGTPYAHEEGETFTGFRTRGAGRYGRPVRWRPGVTLGEAGDSGELPQTTAFRLEDTPGTNVFVQVHTHPWPEGTPIDVRGVGVQRMASGPSDGDALGNFLSNQRINTSVIDYTITPEGVYRTFNGRSQYIAPLQYLNQ